MPRQAWTAILLFCTSHIAGMKGAHHYTESLLEMGSCEIFFYEWSWTMILPISTSQVARMTGLNHCAGSKLPFVST
jgi:hypothetical protein